MFIYKATNLVNGKVYVGKTTRPCGVRWSQHRDDARNGYRKGRGKYRFAAALRKYGCDNFKFEQIDTASSLEELNAKEIKWIADLEATNREKGYNLTNGGDRPQHTEHSKIRRRGYKRPPEVIEKIAAKHRGRPKSAEYKAKMSLARKGIPVSPERAAAMKANPPGLGTKRTPEQRVKIGAGIRASWTLERRTAFAEMRSQKMKGTPCPHIPTEEERVKFIEMIKAKWATMTPEERRERARPSILKALEALKDPDVIRRRTESIRKFWTPERRAEAAVRARKENYLQRINDAKARRVS